MRNVTAVHDDKDLSGHILSYLKDVMREIRFG